MGARAAAVASAALLLNGCGGDGGGCSGDCIDKYTCGGGCSATVKVVNPGDKMCVEVSGCPKDGPECVAGNGKATKDIYDSMTPKQQECEETLTCCTLLNKKSVATCTAEYLAACPTSMGKDVMHVFSAAHDHSIVADAEVV